MEEHDFQTSKGLNVDYLTSGPEDGTLLVFCHGWPAIAKTWKPQLDAFAALGFRCVAPDMPGYGGSSKRRIIEDYSLRNVNSMMADLLAHCGRERAIWIGISWLALVSKPANYHTGHDWGVVSVYSFAAHFPEKVLGLVGLVRPYHTLECGLEEVLNHVNRDIYPEDIYPYAQYDYQVYFQTRLDKISKWFDLDPEGMIRGIYAKGDPTSVGKPSFTARVAKDGGWFGGGETPAAWLLSIPDEMESCDSDLLQEVIGSFKNNGFWSANAWYANQNSNRSYTLNEWRSDGYLEMPVLFIGANWDSISDINISTIAEAQERFIEDLTIAKYDSGHWLALEQADAVNSEIIRWLERKFPESLPGCVSRH